MVGPCGAKRMLVDVDVRRKFRKGRWRVNKVKMLNVGVSMIMVGGGLFPEDIFQDRFKSYYR